MTAQENMNLIREWVEVVNRNYTEEVLACWQQIGTDLDPLSRMLYGTPSD
jgi:hypothetical protein